MADWTDATTLIAALSTGKAVTDEKMQALAENPVALAESIATGTPILVTGWHPYDMVNVGDGATGKIYDIAVNGVVASIASPTMVDGYDYMIRWVGLSHNGGASQTLELTVGGTTIGLSASTNGNTWAGHLGIELPTLENHVKRYFGGYRLAGVGSNAALAGVVSTFSGASTSMTLAYTGGANIDAGQAFFYRCRNYVSG